MIDPLTLTEAHCKALLPWNDHSTFTLQQMRCAVQSRIRLTAIAPDEAWLDRITHADVARVVNGSVA